MILEKMISNDTLLLYTTFERFIKEIKKPRREYEKEYTTRQKWLYIINKKWKRREKYRDILCWIYVEQRKKDIILSYLRIVYDNHSKIRKIIEDKERQCKNVSYQ